MRKINAALGIALTVSGLTTASAKAADTVVLELYTSQGCSSCPPADALLRRLSKEDPSLLPLSFHVHYWDYLGWKDPFSSVANTDRQQSYSRSLGDPEIYTPELVVNGAQAVIGSREAEVRQAIAAAKAAGPRAEVAFSGGTDRPRVSITPRTLTAADLPADVIEVRFNRFAATPVAVGENGGRTLDSINNVLSIRHLGTLTGAAASFAVAEPAGRGEGIAVIVQRQNLGPVLAAAVL